MGRLRIGFVWVANDESDTEIDIRNDEAEWCAFTGRISIDTFVGQRSTSNGPVLHGNTFDYTGVHFQPEAPYVID